jgi:hypothetical protein
MTFYLLCHRRTFLAAQVESIRRHHPDAQIVIVRPTNAREEFPDFPVVQSTPGFSLLILQAVLRSLTNDPAVVLEWDMVLTRPIKMRNACNREPESAGNSLYPSFLSWMNRDGMPDDYLYTQIDRPFSGGFDAVQQRWIEEGDSRFPACAASCYFRSLDNGILHFHHGAGYRSDEGVSDRRRECWNAIMDSLELPHIDAPVPPQPPGLGDMVAAGLSAIGITKERVATALGVPCGCQKRQDALNALGRSLGIG